MSWRTKKQRIISRLSSEAGYKVTCVKPLILYYDNQSALHITVTPVFHERIKHLEIDCHIVRDTFQVGIMKFIPISSKSQLTDFFTKSLLLQPFTFLMFKLNFINIHQVSTWGGDISQ